MFIIHPVTARRVLRKRKRQCTGCKLDNFVVFCSFYFILPSRYYSFKTKSILLPRATYSFVKPKKNKKKINFLHKQRMVFVVDGLSSTGKDDSV